MKTNYTRWRGLACLVLAAGVLTGCTGTPSAVLPPPSVLPGGNTSALPVAASTAAPQPPPPASGGGHGRGGGADSLSAAKALPQDWPAEIPLPPGRLEGSTGGSSRWSVMLLVGGGVEDALASATGFYSAHGFTPGGTAQLHRNGYQVVIVAANRDHSPTETNLTISVIHG